MDEPVRLFIPGFSIPFSNIYLTDTLRLNKFQAEIYRLLEKGKDILVTAPTGGGKTLSLLLNSAGQAVSGFTAIYPNNTLLINQLCTVEDILVEHFGAELIDSSGQCSTNQCLDKTYGKPRRCECCNIAVRSKCVEPLTIYKIDTTRVGNSWSGAKYIALLALSGRYIQSNNGVPKREVLYKLARKILSYRKKGIYIIVFTTPDTYLLLITGAYRSFDLVNKTVENVLYAIAEGKDIDQILRESRTLTRSQVDEIVGFVHRILNQPLFIDEFHLYGLYEVDALHALLNLYKELIGKPVVFSSATPAYDTLNGELGDTPLSPHEVKAELKPVGKGFNVRGDTTVTIIPVDTRKKGLSAYFEAGNAVPDIVSLKLLDEIKNLQGGRALIILERLWMVSYLAEEMVKHGILPDCIASIVPSTICKQGSQVIIGSEATTQGVNLGRVIWGITAGTSSEDIIQRVGRIGRRGVNSHVYLIAPKYKVEEEDIPSTVGSYWDFVSVILKLYPNYPKRKREITNLVPYTFHQTRRKLIYTIGIITTARVSGIKSLYNKIKVTREDAERMLETVIGPDVFVNMLVFRRTGFNIKYIIKETGETGETSIGIIARNFLIQNITKDGRLIISLTPSRTKLRISVLGNPAHYKNKFVSLKTLLKTLIGRIDLGERISIDPSQIQDTIVFITDAGEKLSEFLSNSGEGAEILSPRGRRYAAIFI